MLKPFFSLLKEIFNLLIRMNKNEMKENTFFLNLNNQRQINRIDNVLLIIINDYNKCVFINDVWVV